MATIKSFTSLEQSKKLAEILLPESADMYYTLEDFVDEDTGDVFSIEKVYLGHPSDKEIGCWSLAVLLGVLPKTINNETLFIETSPALWHIGYRNVYTARADNPIDACVELILKLNELKML